jgi:hypothetical protein
MLKLPSFAVVADCGRMELGLLATTVAPTTAAPLGSLTVPTMKPVVAVWANALCATIPTKKTTNTMRTVLLFRKCIEFPPWEKLEDSSRNLNPAFAPRTVRVRAPLPDSRAPNPNIRRLSSMHRQTQFNFVRVGPTNIEASKASNKGV